MAVLIYIKCNGDPERELKLLEEASQGVLDNNHSFDSVVGTYYKHGWLVIWNQIYRPETRKEITSLLSRFDKHIRVDLNFVGSII